VTDRPTTTLRRLLAGSDIVMAPGVPDAFFGRLVAHSGFPAVYMTGSGTTAVRLGMPDIGLLTMTEMVDNAARIVESSGLPVIADADNGYGGPFNVRRTVRAYERAGVAAIHLEDQVIPKRCGHLGGKQLITTAEMVAKIKAATDARRDGDFVLIARTDAIAVEGFEAALDRAAAYEEAGADILFVEAPTTPEQMKTVNSRFRVPQLINQASSGKTPILPATELQSFGYRLAIYPTSLLLSAMRAAQEFLHALKTDGTFAGRTNKMASFVEYFEMLGMSEVAELEDRYAVDEATRIRF
jgi:2-methylisocitrate lyase-like PEP mutase family enzyme